MRARANSHIIPQQQLELPVEIRAFLSLPLAFHVCYQTMSIYPNSLLPKGYILIQGDNFCKKDLFTFFPFSVSFSIFTSPIYHPHILKIKEDSFQINSTFKQTKFLRTVLITSDYTEKLGAPTFVSFKRNSLALFIFCHQFKKLLLLKRQNFCLN